jgi:hypothetical protein
MARRTSKSTKDEELQEALRKIPTDRPGLPVRDSIVGVEKFVSPQNEEYQILKTTETDAYDEPPKRKTPRRPRKKS